MSDPRTRRFLGLAAIAAVAAVTLVIARPALVDSLAQKEGERVALNGVDVNHGGGENNGIAVSNLAGGTGESVNTSGSNSNRDPNRTFHVVHKNGNYEYTTADTLTVEDGSYVLRDNSRGMPETVAVFPLDGIASITLVSHELPPDIHP